MAWKTLLRHDPPNLPVDHMMGTVRTRSVARPVATHARREASDQRLWRYFGVTLGVVVALYLFLDRGFAHFHLPHTPAYVGELVLTFGALCVVLGTRWVRESIAGDPLLALVIAFMAWGLVRTVPNFGTFGIQNSVHDAALWYYSAFALLFIAAATAVPDLPNRWVRGFSRILPALSVWLLVTLLLNKTGVKGPSLRFDNVPLLSHRPGNVCVVAAMCLVWLWLVPDPRRSTYWRTALSILSLVTVIFGATQTRGGGLAAITAIVLGLILIGRRRRGPVTLALVAVLALGIGLASVTGSALHTQKRQFSVSQLAQNIESIGFGSASNPQLQGTKNFRFALWSKILDEQAETSHLVDGFGFGPNLAQIGGVSRTSTHTALLSLRSAHNSLLDIFARTGIIGATLWLMMMIGWYRRMWRAHRRYALSGNEADRGLIDFCMVGTLAIIVNCIFDPTLEGAQVAAVFFCLFGLGIICDRREVLGGDGSVALAEPTRVTNSLHAHPSGS